MIRAINVLSHAAERPYNNTHRAAQAAQTREAILDAVIRVIARGVAELSIPAVAREAGVSIRTVYRNFPSKRELLSGLDDHLDTRIGYSLSEVPLDLPSFGAHIRAYFQSLDGMDDTIRAARASQIAREARTSHGVPAKLDILRNVLDPVVAGLPKREREYIFNIAATLWSQYTLQRMKDDLGLTADQAAETVIWAIETLISGGSSPVVGETDRASRPLAEYTRA